MDKELYSLVDTAIKIGLGAIITGFSAYILALRNHKSDLNKKAYEDRGLLIKELAFKLEDVESSTNDAALHFSNGNVTQAKAALVPGSQSAYSARAISNLIGDDNLVNDLEKICLVIERIFHELNRQNPSIKELGSLGSELKERKLKVYPHIREAYATSNT
ncbi:hypothetical protein TW85_16055 [Marinomonas sp. S3726]|uniref:hypothetical protein n=1 Tax=Marinomonas sp. S3726 TaxID=579484 RepID=UPI0005F9BC6F|nr:hypothetical protein [Marinomonas sp. S3726]KJZ12304.1 hypothetical protein TW85_16055 [Marinomonas sp. S3726]